MASKSELRFCKEHCVRCSCSACMTLPPRNRVIHHAYCRIYLRSIGFVRTGASRVEAAAIGAVHALTALLPRLIQRKLEREGYVEPTY